MDCEVCHREATGRTWLDISPQRAVRFCFCDHVCRCASWMRNDPDMIDMTENEKAAIQAAIPDVGAFIESTGKTDLARFTPEEFEQLLIVTVGAYTDNLRNAALTPGVESPVNRQAG